jgi:hypothetical protein
MAVKTTRYNHLRLLSSLSFLQTSAPSGGLVLVVATAMVLFILASQLHCDAR